MELKLANLNISKESAYFVLALLISLLAWVFIGLTILGGFIALGFAIFMWFGNGLLVANLRSNSVQVSPKQLPVLYKTFEEVCAKLSIDVPDLYVIQSGGLLNAFASRHSGRDFVVLYSDALEACDQDSDEMRFLLGHEIGHLKSKHIFKQILLFPALLLPFLGPAYSRACEISCDRFGAFVAKDISIGMKALLILCGGRNIGRTLDAAVFADQARVYRGFFVSLNELISGYPTFSQRVGYLTSIKENCKVDYPRHPLAYFFAIFNYGAQGSGIFVAVAVIGLMMAIAIPNFLKAKMNAREALARSTLSSMSATIYDYAKAHGGVLPISMSEVVQSDPSASAHDYCGKSVGGYRFECAFFGDDFKLTAVPLAPGTTGTHAYYATKDGVFTEAAQGYRRRQS